MLINNKYFPRKIKPVPNHLNGIRKKVRAEKSLNRRKSRTFFLSNFFPPIFFWFIWNQMCYRYGRPLILKLIPNHEEWNNKIAWFNWNRQRNFSLKFNVAIFKTGIYVKLQTGTELSYCVMQSLCLKMELILKLKLKFVKFEKIWSK